MDTGGRLGIVGGDVLGQGCRAARKQETPRERGGHEFGASGPRQVLTRKRLAVRDGGSAPRVLYLWWGQGVLSGRVGGGCAGTLV